jgi:hypothetical protein
MTEEGQEAFHRLDFALEEKKAENRPTPPLLQVNK